MPGRAMGGRGGRAGDGRSRSRRPGMLLAALFALTSSGLMAMACTPPTSTATPTGFRLAATRVTDVDQNEYTSLLGSLVGPLTCPQYILTNVVGINCYDEPYTVQVAFTVAIARPGYPCYRNVLAARGCEVVELPTGPESRFQPTVAMLEELWSSGRPVQGLAVASPANPTGTMLRPEELAALARWCEEHGVQLISDEIYHGIEYATAPGDVHASAWATSREAVVFSSFSKYFSMTGWRIGWMLVPDRLRRPVDVLTGNFTICPPALAQRAAVAALTPASYDECDGHVARYAENRALLLDGLPRLGIDRLAPADGAFYVYADVGHLTDDSMAFAHRLLADTGIALAPGVDFDTEAGHRFVRLSFAGPRADVDEGLSRLAWYLPRR